MYSLLYVFKDIYYQTTMGLAPWKQFWWWRGIFVSDHLFVLLSHSMKCILKTTGKFKRFVVTFFREWIESFLCSSHCHIYSRNRQHSWILIATWKCNYSLGIYRKLGIYNSGHCMRFFLPLYFLRKLKKCAPSYGLLVIIKDIKFEVLNWERKNWP